MDWLNQDEIDYEVMKWFRPDKDSYSAFWWFEFRNWNPLRELKEILRSYEIQVIKIVWLATDYCVKATVLEALELGFEVEVVEAWIMAVDVNPNDWKAAIDEMKDKGAKFI